MKQLIQEITFIIIIALLIILGAVALTESGSYGAPLGLQSDAQGNITITKEQVKQIKTYIGELEARIQREHENFIYWNNKYFDVKECVFAAAKARKPTTVCFVECNGHGNNCKGPTED